MRGSCLCGAITYAIVGDPVAQVLCHCLDCKRISGSICAYNWVVPTSLLSVVGTPKKYTNTANTGNRVTSHFCGNCGTTLWRDGPASEGLLYPNAGTLDDVISLAVNRKPVAQIFTTRRIAWVKPIKDAQQKEALF